MFYYYHISLKSLYTLYKYTALVYSDFGIILNYIHANYMLKYTSRQHPIHSPQSHDNNLVPHHRVLSSAHLHSLVQYPGPRSPELTDDQRGITQTAAPTLWMRQGRCTANALARRIARTGCRTSWHCGWREDLLNQIWYMNCLPTWQSA